MILLLLALLPLVMGKNCEDSSVCSIFTGCGWPLQGDGCGNIDDTEDSFLVTYELDGTSYTKEVQIVKYNKAVSGSEFDESCDRGIYTENGVEKYLIGNQVVCEALYAAVPINNRATAGGHVNRGGCYFLYGAFFSTLHNEIVHSTRSAELNNMHYCFASSLCKADKHVKNNVCVDCPGGKTRAEGDDPKGADTKCEALPLCGENEHVVNFECTACPAGKHKKAGDRPSRNSECWDDGSCGGDVCVEENTVSCVDYACVCKTGFSGTTCDKDITASGLQAMLSSARKKALPTPEEIQERQNVIKDFVRDTLNQKLKEGASLKSAIEDTKIQVTPQDLPKRAQRIMSQVSKPPAIAVAPPNSDVEDTCSQGANTPGCGMVDIDAESNDTVILTTDPEPGSWTVLTSGGQIVSKQVRVSEFVFEMRCWSGGGWGASSVIDTSDGAVLYECNDNVVMIGSQAGICTSSTCKNGGTCIVDGQFYVCNCTIGWTGTHCETEDTSSYCFEFPCHDYGGFKTVGPCGQACSASACCNYASKSAFDAVCDGTTSAQQYVAASCCHRTFCS